jgi:TIMELESS-interacting protein
MSDSELSDINNDDDLVRRYEKNDNETEDDTVQFNNKGANNEDGKDNEDENIHKKVDPTVTKKRVTRKFYVLNTERLKGPKGIHTIEKLYEGFKFNGKGYEREDLDKVMKRLEYWAFRLFPKLDFDDFLGKCEYLGHKKDLHTHLKKYRLSMITADDICTQNDTIEDEKDNLDTMRREKELLEENTNYDFQKLFDETK